MSEPAASPHATTETLQALARGKLGGDETRRVHQHLLSCRDCKTRFENLASGRDAPTGKVNDPNAATIPPKPAAASLDPPAKPHTSAETIAGGDAPVVPPHLGTLTPNPSDNAVTLVAKPKVFGDYELLREIARGGMGVVFRARQKKLNRVVALKMILAGQFASPDDVKRFYTEAEAAAKLDHPGIVPIYEVGEVEGQHFFSMSFVEGQSLAARVAKGPLRAREAAELLQKIAEAIAYAHNRGVIHRDLKPANVLLDEHDAPRVTDFGLAKNLENESGLTRSGSVMGTPSYMPPEQASGAAGEVGPLADVYSLGAVLYCLLTGRPPFQAATAVDTLFQVMTSEPLSPRRLNPQIPQDLETICLKCLEKSPSRRYSSAAILAEELGRFLRGEPILARPISAPAKLWRWCRRNRAVASLLGTVAVTLIVGTIVAWALAGWALGEKRRADTAAAQAQTSEQIAKASAEAAKKSEETAKKSEEAAIQSAKQATLNEERAIASEALANQEQAAAAVALKQAERDLRRFDSMHYLDRIEAADEALKNNNFVKARQQLDACRWDLKGLELNYLSNQLKKLAPRSLKSAESYATSLALSPDGKRLYTGDWNHSITVWDLPTGKIAKVLKGHKNPVQTLAMSADGTRLYSGAQDNLIKVWDLQSDTEIQSLAGHTKAVWSIALSPDGKRLYSTGGDETVRVWDTQSHQEVQTLATDASGFFSKLALSPDGKKLCWGTKKNTLRVWDLEADKELHSIEGLGNGISGQVFSRDGHLLFLSGVNGSIGAWDLSEGKLAYALTEYLMSASSLALSLDGRRLYSATTSGTAGEIKVWNLETKEQMATLTGSEMRVNSLLMSPDGQRLYAAGYDKAVTIWELNPPPSDPGILIQDYPNAAAFDGDRVYSAAYKAIQVWDPTTRKELFRFNGHEGYITALALHGTRLCSASSDKSIMVWDLDQGVALYTLKGHNGLVSCLAISPDGKFLYSGSDDKTIKTWDLTSGAEVASWEGHSKPIKCLLLHPEARSLLSSGDEGVVKQWKLDGDGTSQDLCRAGGAVACLALSARHNRLFVGPSVWGGGEENCAIEVFDLESGQQQAVLRGHQSGIRRLEVTADQRRLISASQDGDLKIWDPEAEKDLLTIRGHRGGVSAFALSPDETSLVSTGADRYLKFWDLTPPQESRSFRGHSSEVTCLGLSPDSRFLYSGSQDAKIIAWDLDRGLRSFSLAGSNPDLRCIVASPDQQRLFAANSKGEIQIWDLPSRKLVSTIGSHTKPVTRLVLSPDGSQLFSVSFDELVQQWDLRDSKLVRTFPARQFGLCSLCLSADGKRLVTGGFVIEFWNVATGDKELELKGFGKHAFDLCLTPDGQQLISADEDGQLKIWDLESRECIRTIAAHQGSARSVAVSPDGKQVWSSGNDGLIKLWNLESGKELVRLAEHNGNVPALVLSGSTNRLYSGSSDRLVKAWNTGALLSSKKPPRTKPFYVVAANAPGWERLAEGWKGISPWEIITKEDGGKIFSSGSKVSKVIQNVQGNYQLDTEFTRVEGEADINLIFPVGDQTLMLLTKTATANLEQIDGQGGKQIKVELPPGQKHQVKIMVRLLSDDQARVSVTINGKEALTYEGRRDRLTMRQSWKLDAPNSVGLGVFGCTAIFHRVQITPLDDNGEPVKP